MYPELSQQVLLDFSREFDISLLDKVVMTFYTTAGSEVGLLCLEIVTYSIPIISISNKWHNRY
jgi:hypothetical protein